MTTTNPEDIKPQETVTDSRLPEAETESASTPTTDKSTAEADIRDIWKMAQEVSSIQDAETKKKLTIDTPERMGWSKEKTELFHSFIKDFALKEQESALRNKENNLKRIIKNSPIIGKLGHFLVMTSALMTCGTAAIGIGANTIKEYQNPNKMLYSEQNLEKTISVIYPAAKVSTIIMVTLAAGTTMIYLTPLACGIALRRVRRKEDCIKDAQKANGLLVQQITHQIKQNQYA